MTNASRVLRHPLSVTLGLVAYALVTAGCASSGAPASAPAASPAGSSTPSARRPGKQPTIERLVPDGPLQGNVKQLDESGPLKAGGAVLDRFDLPDGDYVGVGNTANGG